MDEPAIEVSLRTIDSTTHKLVDGHLVSKDGHDVTPKGSQLLMLRRKKKAKANPKYRTEKWVTHEEDY